MKNLINKIEDLKTEIDHHMDIDGDYKELIETELNGIIELVNNINYTRCCESDIEQLVCYDNELDCPYEFTSRCTMGRCGCKPKAN